MKDCLRSPVGVRVDKDAGKAGLSGPPFARGRVAWILVGVIPLSCCGMWVIRLASRSAFSLFSETVSVLEPRSVIYLESWRQ